MYYVNDFPELGIFQKDKDMLLLNVTRQHPGPASVLTTAYVALAYIHAGGKNLGIAPAGCVGAHAWATFEEVPKIHQWMGVANIYIPQKNSYPITPIEALKALFSVIEALCHVKHPPYTLAELQRTARKINLEILKLEKAEA